MDPVSFPALSWASLSPALRLTSWGRSPLRKDRLRTPHRSHSHTASALHPPSPRGQASPPLKARALETSLTNLAWIAFVRILLSHLDLRSGHVIPITVFFFFGLVCLFIYLVLWVDGFHEIGKNFKQHFKIYFLLRSSPSGTPNTCTLDCWLLLSR